MNRTKLTETVFSEGNTRENLIKGYEQILQENTGKETINYILNEFLFDYDYLTANKYIK